MSLDEHHRELSVRMSTMAANHDLHVLSVEERARRLALIEAEAPSVLASFAAADGGYRSTSVTNIVTARVS